MRLIHTLHKDAASARARGLVPQSGDWEKPGRWILPPQQEEPGIEQLERRIAELGREKELAWDAGEGKYKGLREQQDEVKAQLKELKARMSPQQDAAPMVSADQKTVTLDGGKPLTLPKMSDDDFENLNEWGWGIYTKLGKEWDTWTPMINALGKEKHRRENLHRAPSPPSMTDLTPGKEMETFAQLGKEYTETEGMNSVVVAKLGYQYVESKSTPEAASALRDTINTWLDAIENVAGITNQLHADYQNMREGKPTVHHDARALLALQEISRALFGKARTVYRGFSMEEPGPETGSNTALPVMQLHSWTSDEGEAIPFSEMNSYGHVVAKHVEPSEIAFMPVLLEDINEDYGEWFGTQQEVVLYTPDTDTVPVSVSRTYDQEEEG